MQHIAVDVRGGADAADLAAELGLPLSAGESCDALLEYCEGRLQLQALGADSPGPIAVDFGSGSLRHRRRGGHNEPLGRAVGVGKTADLQVVDATAGLGLDSFVLADLGCRVTMLERSAVVYALLRDGLLRAQQSDDAWLIQVGERLTLEHAEALNWLAGAAGVDVVYLDPMFPARSKRARAKKEMWLFQQLFDRTEDEGVLLQAALDAARRRVVVKRPAKAPALAGFKPGFQIPGKTVRFDVYPVT